MQQRGRESSDDKMAKGSKKKTKQGEDTATTTLTVRMARKTKTEAGNVYDSHTEEGPK
jgi:hypothetical protein